MKIKEVCGATGLTERAIRFYVQEGLVSPRSQRRGGRTWLDFSETDLQRLRSVAILRKAGFTLEEIRSMGQDFQKNAPEAAFALRRRLQSAIDAYQRLDRANPAQAGSLEEYAALLEQEVHEQQLPESDQIIRVHPDTLRDCVEWLCMAGMVCLFWRLYTGGLDFLSNRSALFSVALWSPLLFLLIFAIFLLPVALLLGSKAGKWLCSHFAYIP